MTGREIDFGAGRVTPFGSGCNLIGLKIPLTDLRIVSGDNNAETKELLGSCCSS